MTDANRDDHNPSEDELEQERKRHRDIERKWQEELAGHREREREREHERERERTEQRDRDIEQQNIGQLNGKWAFLLKAVLVTTPAAWAMFVTIDLPWRIWVTKVNFASQSHLDEAEKLTLRIEKLIESSENDRRWIQQSLADQPPKMWQDRISALEGFDRENRNDHTRIMISLEAIKAKLNIPPEPQRPPALGNPTGEPGHGSTANDRADSVARNLSVRDAQPRAGGQ